MDMLEMERPSDELNDLENINSFSKKLKIWGILFCTWLTPTIGKLAGVYKVGKELQ